MLNTNETPTTIITSPKELDAYKEAQLKIAIHQGIDDLVEGRASSSEDVVERLRNRII